jgi:hypothetical protein
MSGQPVRVHGIQQPIGRRETVKDPDTPKGTLALLLVYTLIIIALWSNAYLTMMARGVAQ